MTLNSYPHVRHMLTDFQTSFNLATFGELWSTNERVYEANVYPPKMNTARAV